MRIAKLLGAVGLLVVAACLEPDGPSHSEEEGSNTAQAVERAGELAVRQQALESALCGNMAGLQANAAWPMYGGCPTHAAQSSQFGPTAAKKNWSTYLSGNVKGSPVIAADGSIFVGSDGNQFFKINRTTGVVIKQEPTWGKVRSAPAIGADGTVYIGDDSGTFYAVNPSTLKAKWTVSWIGAVNSSPVIGPDGTIYFGSNDNNLYAHRPDGSRKWSHFTGTAVISSPAVGPDGTIYFGSDITLYALKPDGTKKWTKIIGFPITSSPALGRFGRVYIGAGDKLLAYEASTGNFVWEKSLGSCTVYAPAIGQNGVIYVGTGFSLGTGGSLYALSPDGEILWHVDVLGGVQSAPIVDRAGNIYFGANDNGIYAVDSAGNQIWKYATQGNVQSSPALDPSGAVIVGANDNNLYSIGVGATRIANGASCTNDEQCIPGLVCGVSNGPRFGLAATARACWIPSCENKVQDPGETEVDCGGPCGSCASVCSLACKLGDQVSPPALEVLPFSKGSFVRATYGTYQIGASKLGLAGGNVLRFEDRGDGLGRLALFEGARTNRLRFSEQLGHAPEWRMPGGGTPIVSTDDYAASPLSLPTADRMVAPAGGYPSRTQTLGTNLPAGVLSAWLRLSNASGAASSTRTVLSDSSNRWYSSTTPWALTGTWARQMMATTATTGAADLSFSHKGGWPGNAATFPQLDAADFLAWGLQLEEGAFASSYIPTTDDPELRMTDRLVFEAADVPAWLRTGMWQIDVVPIFAPADLSIGDEATLVAWENGQLTLGRDAAGGVLKVASGNASAKLSVSWAQGAKFTVTLDFVAHTVGLRGAKQGDGSNTIGSVAIPVGRLGIGARLDGTKPAFAKISEIRRVAAAWLACAPDPDCIVCGDGRVGAGEACDTGANARCSRDCSAAGGSLEICDPTSPVCGPGRICGAGNGANYGLAAQTSVCEPAIGCGTAAAPPNSCGDLTKPCGFCACSPSCAGKQCTDAADNGCGSTCTGFCGAGQIGCVTDEECPPQRICVPGAGRRFGMDPSVNLCLEEICAYPEGSVPPNCGAAGATCGTCDACVRDCSTKACGSDGCGGSCGDCPGGSDCLESGQCLIQPLLPEITGAPPLPPSETKPGVGTTPGAFHVNHDGAAVYTIPIEVPPGRHGFQPALAFEYKSLQAKSIGLMGAGWKVTGLSSIARCPHTSKHDGTSRGVMLDGDDAYCLDGARLVSVGTMIGAGEAGGALELRTELDSHIRVLVNGTGSDVLANPTTFIVFLPDGTRRVYGGSTVEATAANKRYLWALALELSPHGDTIRYRYETVSKKAPPLGYATDCNAIDPKSKLGCSTSPLWKSEDFTADLRLTRVDYGGFGCISEPCSTVMRPDHLSVAFDYGESAPEQTAAQKQASANDGVAVPGTTALNKVTTLVADAPVREYRVTYENIQQLATEASIKYGRTPRVRAKTLQECTPTSECNKPHVFTYATANLDNVQVDQIADHAPYWQTSPPIDVNYAGYGTAVDRIYALDANGDGIADLLWPRAGNDWTLRLGGDDEDIAPTQLSLTLPPTLRYRDVGSAGQTRMFSWERMVAFGDFDGDGRDDMLAESTVSGNDNDENTRLDIYHFAGQNFSRGIRLAYAAQNGLKKNRHHHWTTYDADGDGWQDILVCDTQTNKWRVLWNDRGEFVNEGGFDARGSCLSFGLLDFDDDGVQEMVAYAPVAATTEAGYFHALKFITRDQMKWVNTHIVAHSKFEASSLVTLDADGDGRQDVLVGGNLTLGSSNQPTTNARLWMNGVLGFSQSAGLLVSPSTWGYTALRNAVIHDLDGNGADDVILPIARAPANSFWRAYVPDPTNADLPAPRKISAATTNVAPLSPFSFTTSRGEMASGAGYGTAIAADINGDGRVDHVVPSMTLTANSQAMKIMRYQNYPETNLLQTIDDGSGRKQTVSYTSGIGMGNSVVRKHYEAAASCDDLDSFCLKTVPWGTVINERRGDMLREYTYTDARVERGGRGWLGYRQRMIREAWPDHETITRISYDHSHQSLTTSASEAPLVIAPFAGQPQVVEHIVALPSGDLTPGAANLHHLESTTKIFGIASSDKGIPFVHVDTETHSSFEESIQESPVFGRFEESFEGRFSLGPVSTVVTDYDVDEFANVKRTTETTFAGAPTADLVEKRATREVRFEPTTTELSLWELRYPKDQFVTFEGGTTPAKTRFEKYEYEHGFLKSLSRAYSREGAPFVTAVYTPNNVRNIASIEVSDPLQAEQRLASFIYDSREVNVKEARQFPSVHSEPLVWSTDFSEAFGTLLVSVAPDDTVVKYSYDGLGRLAWIDEETGTTNGSDTVLSTQIAWFNDAVSAGALGNCLSCTSWSRESRGQGVLGTTPTGDSEVVVGYTPEGQPAFVQMAGLDGHHVAQTTTYDATGRVLRQWAPYSTADEDLSPSTIFEYDNLGRLIGKVDGVGAIRYSYASAHTLEGHQALTQSPEGSWWLPKAARWFVQGNNGRTLAMDAAGRTVARDVGTGIVRTGYDGRDSIQLISVDGDAAQRRTRFTDAWGRLQSQHDPDSGDYSYQYLGTGELKTEVVPGVDVSYKYDGLGRVTERVAGSEKQTFFWDQDESRKAKGHLLRGASAIPNPLDPSATDEAERRFYYVNSGGKVSGTQDDVAGQLLDTAYSYDANGRVDVLTYPQSGGVGLQVKHGYDNRGHLISLRDNSASAVPGQPGYRPPFWTFNEADRALRIRRETLGDGSSLTRTYDSGRGYMKSVALARTGTPSKSWGFNYDPFGRASSASIGATTTRSIHHDAAGRLSSIEENGAAVESYTYATSGSLTGSDQFAAVSYAHPDGKGGPNAVASVPGYSYGYGDRGNVQRRETPTVTQAFVLNSFNLPGSVSLQRGTKLTTAALRYSAFGDRVTKTIHDGDAEDDPVLERTFQVGKLYRQTVTGGSTPVTSHVFRLYVTGREIGTITKTGNDTATRYFVDDGVGSPLAVSHAAGVTEIARRAYGEVSTAAAPTDARRFGGHEYDANLELVDMGGRLYDPHIGRFMSPDPFAQDQLSIDSLNRYAYGLNDPLSYIDPTGFQSTQGQSTDVPITGGTGKEWPIGGATWDHFNGPFGSLFDAYGKGVASTWSESVKAFGQGIWDFSGGFAHAVSGNLFLPSGFEPGDPESFFQGQLLGSVIGINIDKQAVIGGWALLSGGSGLGAVAEGPSLGLSTGVIIASVSGGTALVGIGVAGGVRHVQILSNANAALEQLHLAFSKSAGGPPGGGTGSAGGGGPAVHDLVPSLHPERAPGSSPHPFPDVPKELQPQVFDIISDLQMARAGDAAAAGRLAGRTPHALTGNLRGWTSLDIAGRSNPLRFLYREVGDGIKWMVRDTH